MQKILTFVFIFSWALGAMAKAGKFFNSERQLSSSFVTQVYVDNEGFLWVTTRDGINRYDGYQFRVFKRENDADKTLASNYVNSMMQDSRGLFYFGMYGALQTWDGNEFHNVTMKDLNGNEGYCYATCFLERKNGDVLAGTSGLGVMKFTGPSTAQQIGGQLASLHTVNSLLEDHRGRLWLVTDRQGLLCYDGYNCKEYLSERNDLYGLCEDHEGNVYVGTSNSGLYRQQGDTFVHIEGTGQKAVSALYCNSEGMILIGYDGSGLAIYNPRNQQLTDNPFFSLEVDLSKSKMQSMVEDQNGNLWLGMMQKGIYKQPVARSGFYYQGVKLGPANCIGSAFIVCVFVDSKGRTWLGTDKDGLYCLSPDRTTAVHLQEGYPSVVMAVNEDRQGRIWIGSYQEGFGWIDPQTLKYHRQSYAYDNHLIVMDMAVDDQDRLWMATMKHGVMCMNLSDGSIREYRMAPSAGGNRQVNSIANDYVSQISLSPDGRRLYVSTSMGLCCLDIPSDSWTKAFGVNCLHYSQPIRVTKEHDGVLWVATNDGLYRFDLDGKELNCYTRENGLTDNGIASMEFDGEGNLWLGTNHGLSCLNPATGDVETYYVDDGLQSDEFGDNSSWRCSDGLVIMGGTGGLTWFYPWEVMQTSWNANVQLTGFFVSGLQVNTSTLSGNELVMDTTSTDHQRFRLSYQDNSFAIQLSTLTFDNPDYITYLYSINGEPFIRLQQGMNVLTFLHMSPGTYQFRVKAERNNHVTDERLFTVVVEAPWYRSLWAYLLYAALLVGAIGLYLAYRRRKEQDRLRLQEHIHAEEMADAKLRFFINISHEIRTPMTLIVSPLLSLIKNEKDPQLRGTYETMHRNANRILGLINQMMDLRKIDKGQMQMRMKETDLVDFVADIHSLFQPQAEAKQIDLHFEHDTDSLPVWIDRKNFDKVIVNILSNAFKFTPSGGRIDIRLSHDSQQAFIAISDNGEKIPEDKLQRIFERFYQSPSKVNDRHTGTGIGLDLTRSLVELHHGTISAHNLDEGCEFVVTLPLGNAHLKPEEMVVEKEEDGPETENYDQEEEQPQAAEQVPAESPRRMDGRKVIVLVEDDDEIRRYLANELGTDYEVKACVNGRQALGEIYRTLPDLVISDVMMPEMDGNALCSKLKANTTTNHIPVILLTAKSSDDDRLEGLESGADAYIVKPFNIDILRRTIINLISTHQMLRLKYERNDSLEDQLESVELPKSPDEKLLERIMATVNKHLSDSDLNVDMIAEEVGISRVHLHRKMKELTGQTPHDFIRNLRLKRAATLLASQSMNVNEVMYACGFSNSTSFSTIFKRFYGMSPRDYIHEHDKRSFSEP